MSVVFTGSLNSEMTESLIRLKAYSPAIEFMDKDGVQNWYCGLDDNLSNAFLIGRGYGPGQDQPWAVLIDTDDTVSIGGDIGAMLDVEANNDNVAWFRRQSSTEALIRYQHYSGGNTPPQTILAGFGFRGTITTPVKLEANDPLFLIDGRGYDGSTETATSCQIAFRATEQWGTSAHGSRIELFTTPNGSLSPQSRLVIDNDGAVCYMTSASSPAWTFDSTHANGGILAIQRSGNNIGYLGSAAAGLGGSYGNSDMLVYSCSGSLVMFSASLAAPSGVTDGAWWVECVGTSPSRVCAIKVHDGGTTRTIASMTY